MGCYVPVLTRCPSVPLHRSEKRHANYSRGKLIAIYGEIFAMAFGLLLVIGILVIGCLAHVGLCNLLELEALS